MGLAKNRLTLRISRFQNFCNQSRSQWQEYLLIAILLMVFFFLRMPSISFHPDESQWIASSNLFDAFIKGDFNSIVWENNNWSQGNPVMTSYFIGIGRTVRGYGIETLNKSWDFAEDVSYNINAGAMPTPELLFWSRSPMVILSVIIGLVVFFLVFKTAGRISAYLSVTLFALNQYFQTTLLRSMSEAPMLAFICLSMVAAENAMGEMEDSDVRSEEVFFRKRRLWIWWAMAGILLGFSAESKLNGFSIFFGLLCLWWLLPFQILKIRSMPARIGFVFLGTCALFLISALIFVIVNPYLYSDPFGRTINMLQSRLGGLEAQQNIFSDQLIPASFPAGVLLVFRRIFMDYSFFHFSSAWFVNAGLFITGVGFLIAKIIKKEIPGSTKWPILIIFFVGITASVPSLLTPLDWDRYYLLPVFFSQILISIGLFYFMRWAWNWLRPLKLLKIPRVG